MVLTPKAARASEQINDPLTAFRMLGEKLKANAYRPNIYGYKPHEKQELFHKSTATRKLYIGGNRSGKTVGGIVEDIWWATKRHPYRSLPEGPVRGRIVSTDFVNGIEKIILPEISRWVIPSDLAGGSWTTAYNKSLRTLNFENGSFIEFMSADQDLDKFAGTSRHFIHFDEEPPEHIYTENVARLIDTGGSLWITMTPVEGMTWIYDNIYEPAKRKEKGYFLVEIDMTENPYLGAAEVQAFVDALSEDEKEARVHGRFVVMGGLIYKAFDPAVGGRHVLKRDYVPQRGEMIGVSLDHGFNNPTAILWHAVSPDGYVTTFYELYASGLTVDKWAVKIHSVNKLLGVRPEFYVADPSIKNTDPLTGTSIHQEYAKFNVPFILGNNDVQAGIAKTARYIEPRKDKLGKEAPSLWRVSPNCVNLIRELQRYRWQTYSSKKTEANNNPYDKPQKKNDHACDSLRYFLMSRPDLISDNANEKNILDRELRQEYDVSETAPVGGPIADPWRRVDLGNPEYIKFDNGWSAVDDIMGQEW